MHVAARARLVLARSPWLYWAVVATFTTVAVVAVQGEMASIAAERDRWGSNRSVLVAREDHEPGDPITADLVALPLAAVPNHALAEAPTDARARQRIGAGEVVTELDVIAAAGPAATAEAGTTVVALSDPLARNVVVGLRVRVAADGIILTAAAAVTDVIDDVVFVAVDDRDAAAVAAAAQQGIATLLYLP